MSTELHLLKVLGSDKHLFNRVGGFIKEHSLSKEPSLILKDMNAYYEANDADTEIDWGRFALRFLATTKMSTEDREVYRMMFERLEELELSSITDVTEVIAHYIKLDYATRIIDIAMKIADGDKKLTLDDVLKNVMDYHKEIGDGLSTEGVFTTTDISAVTTKVASGGWEWRLEPLNISLGPLRIGDFVVVGARPETGKTTFLASELTYMASQFTDERPIIWVNNEENSDKVMFRVVQAALGCHSSSILTDPAKAMSEYAALVRGKDRILITEKNAKRNNVNYLSGLIAEMNPALIVFDQLDKVKGFDKESRDDLRLGKLYEWGRELTESAAVIAISQASGSAEGERWIYQNQLRGSTTDKAGEADAIVTIGRVNDPALQSSRFIHVPKNKLFGGPRSDEAQRHGYFEAEIQPDIARYSWAGTTIVGGVTYV